jgi:hypothetical protein
LNQLTAEERDSMAGQNFDRKIALASSAFAFGLAAGWLLKGGAKQLYDRARLDQAHDDFQRTLTFDENLPEQLGRREPTPEAGQPRFGGTGALGVSPAAEGTARTDE